MCRSTKGRGLGLATVKRIVELHGSEIRVDSFVDRATGFRFDLPLAQCPRAARRVANVTPS